MYNVKITQCANGYTEIKKYSDIINTSERRDIKDKVILNDIKKLKGLPYIDYHNHITVDNEPKTIRYDSLSRTRDNIILLTSNNDTKFKTFITLTFKDIIDIENANKYLNIWLTDLRRDLKKDNQELFYLGVPEYQKRGAIHYHIFTSLEINSKYIPYRPTITTYNIKNEKYINLNYYDLLYWTYGYSTAIDITRNNKNIDSNFNLALYMCKYLYKDLDNRLFQRRKILKSNNIEYPNSSKVLLNNETYQNALNYLVQNYPNQIKIYNNEDKKQQYQNFKLKEYTKITYNYNNVDKNIIDDVLLNRGDTTVKTKEKKLCSKF